MIVGISMQFNLISYCEAISISLMYLILLDKINYIVNKFKKKF